MAQVTGGNAVVRMPDGRVVNINGFEVTQGELAATNENGKLWVPVQDERSRHQSAKSAAAPVVKQTQAPEVQLPKVDGNGQYLQSLQGNGIKANWPVGGASVWKSQNTWGAVAGPVAGAAAGAADSRRIEIAVQLLGDIVRARLPAESQTREFGEVLGKICLDGEGERMVKLAFYLADLTLQEAKKPIDSPNAGA